MPSTLPLISATPPSGEAAATSSSATSNCEDGGKGAPFAEVLAKAAGEQPAGKTAASPGQAATADKPAEAKAAGGAATPAGDQQGTVSSEIAAILLGMGDKTQQNPDPKEAILKGKEPSKEKSTTPSATVSGNDLPPLAVAASTVLLMQSANQAPVPASTAEAAQGGPAAGAQSGAAIDKALAAQDGAAALRTQLKAEAAGTKDAFGAIKAALQTQGAASHGPDAVLQSALGRPPEAALRVEMTAALAKDGQAAVKDASAAGVNGRAAQGGTLSAAAGGQAGAMFAVWPGTVGISSQQGVYQGALTAPLPSQHWAQDLGQQLLIGLNGNAQTVTLHVNPPQLGPLQVHLQVADGQASALFVSPHLAVRQALEGALPQLRDIFAGAGMSLTQSQVSADSGGSRRDRPQQGGRAGSSVLGIDEESAPAPIFWRQGFVNTYV